MAVETIRRDRTGFKIVLWKLNWLATRVQQMHEPGVQERMLMLSAEIQHALATERTIDITTTGRRSGKPRRLEIWYHYIDDQVYITGSPGLRSWYANLLATPALTFHLKQSVSADLPARAVPVTEEAERRAILGQIVEGIDLEKELEDWVARSPLVRIEILANG